MDTPQRILIIGGHGKVALQTAPLLTEQGHSVISVIRDPKQRSEVEATGASAHIADVRELDAQGWDALLKGVDTLIWSAGAGGKGGVDNTYAVDRDAAIASMRSATRAGVRYIMVSFWGSTTREIPTEHPLYHYGVAKRAADEVLLDSDLEFVILAPTALSDAPAGGMTLASVDASSNDPAADTSRELVARVAAYEATARHLPNTILPFHDGDDAIPEALGAVAAL